MREQAWKSPTPTARPWPRLKDPVVTVSWLLNAAGLAECPRLPLVCPWEVNRRLSVLGVTCSLSATSAMLLPKWALWFLGRTPRALAWWGKRHRQSPTTTPFTETNSARIRSLISTTTRSGWTGQPRSWRITGAMTSVIRTPLAWGICAIAKGTGQVSTGRIPMLCAWRRLGSGTSAIAFQAVPATTSTRTSRGPTSTAPDAR
mmetsp:Transcript_20305/g.49376  ORF Transcript_20305/g.49376 Transcript_20305/m.49376 type:complete len:203 (-) Transcript_20305:244-852(-)